MSDFAHMIGHWGPITSNIVWCEEKYAVSYYVAEFWNTLSNLPAVVIAFHHFKRGFNLKVPFTLNLCNLLLSLVYIGSTLYHCTLRYEMQMLDELPMMLVISQCLFCLLIKTFPTCKRHPLLVLASVYTLSSIGVIFYLYYSLAIVFQILFGSMTAVLAVLSCALAQKVKGHTHLHCSARSSLLRSVVMSVIAFNVWLYDNTCCHHLKSARGIVGEAIGIIFQFHGWWHILSANAGLWYIAGLSALIRSDLYVTTTWLVFPKLNRKTEDKNE